LAIRAAKIGGVGKIGIQTFAVLGANVSFVFQGIGREIGGIAAPLAALGRGDIKGFKFIGKSMKEDAAEARRVLDEFERKTLAADEQLNDERQENSVETTDAIIRDRKAEADTYKKNINDQIGDAERLQGAMISAFSTPFCSDSTTDRSPRWGAISRAVAAESVDFTQNKTTSAPATALASVLAAIGTISSVASR
jgi:hypothetical protein